MMFKNKSVLLFSKLSYEYYQITNFDNFLRDEQFSKTILIFVAMQIGSNLFANIYLH